MKRAAPRKSFRAKAEGEAVPVPPSLEAVHHALSAERDVAVEKGWGSSSIVLKTGGKIFAMLVGSELVLKLPKTRVDALVQASGGRRFDPRRDGRVMKEWVVLAPNAPGATALAREAYQFVSGVAK